MSGLIQPVDALLPPGVVQLAGQVVPGVTATKYESHITTKYILLETDLVFCDVQC